MPRVHRVLKARKAQPGAGIAAGDTYYWWKFRYGGKHVSKTPPKPSQLTQSEYYGALLTMEENWTTGADRDDAVQAFRSLAEEVESLGSEQSDKLSNMPDSLQQGSTGELLQSRADRCEAIAEALNQAADELEAWTPEESEDTEAEDGAEGAEPEEDTGWEEEADRLWGDIDWSPE